MGFSACGADFSACGADSSALCIPRAAQCSSSLCITLQSACMDTQAMSQALPSSACRCRGLVKLRLSLHRYAGDSMNSGFGGWAGMAGFLRRFLAWADNVGVPPRGAHISELVEGSETCIRTCVKMPQKCFCFQQFVLACICAYVQMTKMGFCNFYYRVYAHM